MQKSIKLFLLTIAVLTIGFFLTSCGEKEIIISTFDFKETSYTIELDAIVNVELNLEEAVIKENIVYASANPEVATFVSGVLKGVSVGETTISISYKDEANDLTKTISVKVTRTAEEQANYDAAMAYDAKVAALTNYTSSDVDALKALVEELDTLDMNVLKYVTKGDAAIEMYNKARALVIDELIAALPEVVEVSHEKQIKEAREAYELEEANVKKYVTKTEELKAKEDALAKAIYDATPDGVKLTYQEESYTKINGNIVILVDTVKKDPDTVIVWESSNPAVATVVDGVVTGLKAGTAIITATIEGTEYTMSVGVTILEENVSEAVQFILDSHNSSAYTKRRLPIGSGTPNYYYNVMGSVSDYLFKDLIIEEQFLATGNASGEYYVREDYNADVEFVTVHYTANFTSGAKANANYMANKGSGVSIHYVTGNDGIYHCLDDELYGAWHAGDSGSRYYSNSTESVTLGSDTYQTFTWLPTGVKYDGTDLLDIVWSASDDFYYEINGKKTTVKLPTTYNAKSRTTNHIYNNDGTVSSAPGYAYPFENRPVESFFNNQDFAVKVIDGEYYMGPTWWSYGQVYEGRICAMGGNINSIGIESCVDKGSNLWYTWQETAKLVAQLLKDNNLTIDRVKGHHFFDGKDCPQPMLENDQEIWYEFLNMIEAEYKRITELKDYTFYFEAENSTYVHKLGYIKKWASTAQSVGYTVTVQNGGTTEIITLYSWVPAK